MSFDILERLLHLMGEDEIRSSCSLDFSRKSIYQVPYAIGELTNLFQLHLQHNEFVDLPLSIKNLTSLTYLDISWNKKLSYLPPAVYLLNNLAELSIVATQISELPEDVEQLTALTKLNFAQDSGEYDLRRIPSNFFTLPCSSDKEIIKGINMSSEAVFRKMEIYHDRVSSVQGTSRTLVGYADVVECSFKKKDGAETPFGRTYRKNLRLGPVNVLRPPLRTQRYTGGYNAIMHEANKLYQLKQRNLLSLLGYGEDRMRYYYIYEDHQGITLSELIKKQGRIPAELASHLTRDVNRGLLYLHRQHVPIQHGDIRSDTILVQDGSAKLMNCGLIELRDLLERQDGSILPLAWLAPETFLEDACKLSADMYGLGLVIWSMLNGRFPFENMAMCEMISHKLQNTFFSFPQDSPSHLVEIANRCLCVDPDQRATSVFVERDFRMRLKEPRLSLSHADAFDSPTTTADGKPVPVELGPLIGRVLSMSISVMSHEELADYLYGETFDRMLHLIIDEFISGELILCLDERDFAQDPFFFDQDQIQSIMNLIGVLMKQEEEFKAMNGES